MHSPVTWCRTNFSLHLQNPSVQISCVVGQILLESHLTRKSVVLLISGSIRVGGGSHFGLPGALMVPIRQTHLAAPAKIWRLRALVYKTDKKEISKIVFIFYHAGFSQLRIAVFGQVRFSWTAGNHRSSRRQRMNSPISRVRAGLTLLRRILDRFWRLRFIAKIFAVLRGIVEFRHRDASRPTATTFELKQRAL